MSDNDPGNDAVDRALRVFVYAPVGLACYLRDSAPTLMEVLVSRGRREVEGAKRTVEDKLGFAKPEPPPDPPVHRRVADGIGKVASQAGTVAAAVAGTVVNAATNSGASSTDSSAASNGGTSGGAGDLPISGYDGLSASQVIERLDGLSRGSLERIRAYERAHRARRTVLASIDQLIS